MPTLSFNIPGETPSKLEILWEAKYKKLQVFLNGEKVSTDFPTQKDLVQGYQITTTGNHTINIKYLKSWVWSRNSALEVSCDGQILPNSGTKDNVQIKDATSCTGFIAIVGLVFTLYVFAVNSDHQISSLIVPVIYLLLWLFIRKNNSTALMVFAIIYALETVYTVVILITGSYPQTIAFFIPSMILRIVVLVMFINAVRSMVRLNNKKKEIKSTSAFDSK